MEKTILIVDDSATVRVAVKMALKSEYEIIEGKNGKDALAVAERHFAEGKRINLIITDINMPIMGGIEFIKEIKQNRNAKFTPILVLTTESQDSMKMEGKKAGATGWLVKPFKPEQLQGIVKKVIK
ncbi:MAG TPA: response regulator [Thermotogota bacterium]|nr:response regulator [Thermotogota bacterium]HPJ89282.1 response regulator [Thermotogota bacterium]HPR96426.1 response regulator [Thermotogota bacterium]